MLHDNRQAKRLYQKLGFRNLPTFAVKRKNGINEQLFLGLGHKPTSTRTHASSSTKRCVEASRYKWTMPPAGCSPSAWAGAAFAAVSRSAT